MQNLNNSAQPAPSAVAVPNLAPAVHTYDPKPQANEPGMRASNVYRY